MWPVGKIREIAEAGAQQVEASVGSLTAALSALALLGVAVLAVTLVILARVW